MKLLNIDDNESDFQLILHHLKQGGVKNVVGVRVSNEEELRAALEREKWSVVISDYDLPGIDPLQALKLVRDTSKYLPFIVVSGMVGEESVAEMMKAGVQDFVIKSRLERLGPVIRRSLRELAVHEQEARSRTIAKRALAAKEEMLAIVYHDIKNPLAAIQLDAQLLDLLSKKDPGPEIMKELSSHAQRVLRTVDRLKVLVSDLLEHNNPFQNDDIRPFAIRKSAHNPVQIINDVLDSLRPLIQEKNIVIHKVMNHKRMNAWVDQDRIHQVLSNILSNALKFSTNNREIWIELNEVDSGETIFTITDDGPGIEATDLSRIFEKYWTCGSGNGLGLFICKSIIEAHGGTIEAFNDENKGAKFVIKIPPPTHDISIEETSYAALNLNPKRNEIIKTIYLVDDDNDLREVMSWALEKEGHRVLSFDKAQSALDALEHTFYPPDLIILDFHMGAMNGNEFLSRKQSSGEDFINLCPVIMISAAPDEVKKSTHSSLYTDILIKPVELSLLLRTVKQYL